MPHRSIQSITLNTATENDIAALEVLVNSAYRGESSKKGWTTEADLLGGIRTDASALFKLIQDRASVILKYTDKTGDIQACMHLKKKGAKLYLGMLTVSPELQDQGIGKQLLAEAEEYAKQNHCSGIIMTVISIRHELISWYERQGYYATGETEPFPTDPSFGLPRQPLFFIVMEKKI
jgi:ribosomal protein S18 acetylase RimI-like enzyme